MELRPVSPAPTPAAAPAAPAADVKRAQLQAMLLQKSLQAQQNGIVAAARAGQGKGKLLDIRV